MRQEMSRIDFRMNIYANICTIISKSYGKLKLVLHEHPSLGEPINDKELSFWPNDYWTTKIKNKLGYKLPFMAKDVSSIPIYSISRELFEKKINDQNSIQVFEFNAIRDYFSIKRLTILLNSYKEYNLYFAIDPASEKEWPIGSTYSTKDVNTIKKLSQFKVGNWGCEYGTNGKIKLLSKHGVLLENLFAKHNTRFKIIPIKDIAGKKVNKDFKKDKYYILESDRPEYIKKIRPRLLRNFDMMIRDEELYRKCLKFQRNKFKVPLVLNQLLF